MKEEQKYEKRKTINWWRRAQMRSIRGNKYISVGEESDGDGG